MDSIPLRIWPFRFVPFHSIDSAAGYLQVLDIALNKPLKDLVRDKAELHYDQNFEQWKNNSYSVGDRRILLTKWVAEACKQLHVDNKDTIIRTFRKVGLTLNADGSEHHELAIKDMGDIQIEDYSRDIPVDIDEEMLDSITVALPDIPDSRIPPKAPSKRPNTRSRGFYFRGDSDNDEIAEDPANETTDSEDGLADNSKLEESDPEGEEDPEDVEMADGN
ncbi:MAG: hypothetical protein MMC33_010279 [Icmadophila ericetorum]|nr:hypothetical protein [Icmadophila ericetorum]